MNPLRETRRLGQQIWLDNLSRTLLYDGELERLVQDDGVAGITTNPAIFEKAIAAGRYYEEELAALRSLDLDAEERYERLAIADVRRACDLLRDEYERSDFDAGYVSLEVSPALAHDTAGTVDAARRLRTAVARDNLLIKVPATPAGIAAVERLVSEGISVNVTLMFSLAHCEAVAAAFERGIARLLTADGNPSRVKSVASLFLSRVDTLVDQMLEEFGADGRELSGRSAVAMAKLAYRAYCERCETPSFKQLRAHGVRPQQMLWASTGTKNPAYSDLLYVEPLIGPETVNTVPDATLEALRRHGRIASTLADGIDQAQQVFARLAHLGIDMTEVGERLQRDGLIQFEKAFARLLETTA
ncbi:MAG: transaldolase [Rhodocyclaceae bacterium]|nr:transaldolase [Rhodocyclaceae bacterium]